MYYDILCFPNYFSDNIWELGTASHASLDPIPMPNLPMHVGRGVLRFKKNLYNLIFLKVKINIRIFQQVPKYLYVATGQ
jgi:hypothetical protein